MNEFDPIKTARRVINTEMRALELLSESLAGEFVKITEHIANISGRVILSGVGKSGHVARKISATLASTGTPSFFIHPTEASHGDMGMITKNDCVIALSRSGETKELADIISFCKRHAITLIAMTTKQTSALGKGADYILLIPKHQEACAITDAPTTSTTLQIALGDALAVALLEAKGFTKEDFRDFHPGGNLGAQLTKVTDLMHEGEQMPLVGQNEKMQNTLLVLSDKGFGCVGVIEENGDLCGIITDGDIRRNLDKNLLELTAGDIMTQNPKTVSPDTMAASALHLMTAKKPKIMQVFVTDQGKPVGILHMHDLLRAGLS